MSEKIDPQPEGQAKITGYKKHTQAEIDQVNRNKEFENHLGDLVASVKDLPDVDQRWAAIARTHFQEGFMALNRAIFQPDSRL